MPTIKQLPAATAAGGSDLLPISQSGLTRAVTVSTLLGNTQPLLSLSQGTLVGRVSAGLGGAEAVSVGTGLSVQSGTIVATGSDHPGFTLATSLLAGDEVVLNSSAAPKRLPATQLRSLFSAGIGIQIDSGGVISATGSSASGSNGGSGPVGPQGASGEGFTFRGAWQANTDYSPYDVVTNGGQTYLAANAVSGAATFVPDGWSLLAAQGAAGATGAAGAPGVAGATGPVGPTIAATPASVGAVKPGSGLTVAFDGTLSITNVALSSIAQGNAALGQLLGWNGTGWAPTTPAAGISFTGSAPITVASGVVSIGQNGASNGQVLTWNGTAWVPQQMPATGAVLGTALPTAAGPASAGISASASREDHRHPSDVTRAPLAGPVFISSLTLPSWTTNTRPASPGLGMEGFATDTGRRETYTAAGWVQYVRLTDLPAANGQLLGGASLAGAVSTVAIGSGLSLAAGVLSAMPSTAATITGVSIDGSSIVASSASPYQMGTNDRVIDINKTTGEASKVILPANPTIWTDYTVIDGKGDASTNNITISGTSGVTINGQNAFTMNANNDAVTLRAVSATAWRIV